MSQCHTLYCSVCSPKGRMSLGEYPKYTTKSKAEIIRTTFACTHPEARLECPEKCKGHN